jgi:hypothetical protein
MGDLPARLARHTQRALLAAAVGVLVLAWPSVGICGGSKRSLAIRAEFKRHEPCPATGRARGPCVGFEVDHAVPLCLGGPDIVSNLQWLTIEAHRHKTRRDVELCRQAKASDAR